jgi:hypothetical protein
MQDNQGNNEMKCINTNTKKDPLENQMHFQKSQKYIDKRQVRGRNLYRRLREEASAGFIATAISLKIGATEWARLGNGEQCFEQDRTVNPLSR